MRMTVKAHAKINWALNILSTREDGYHELDMLMQSIDLHDEMTFEKARWLTLTIDGQPLPVGGRNLVIRAANALNEYTGQRRGARIQLKKRIPVRAGLGGGSADCAMTLLALNRLWECHLPMQTLLEIGRTLGADVPFCMTGGLARVGGIGENIEPIAGAPSVPIAMVTPGGGLSTPAVFREWDESCCKIVPMDTQALAQALTAGDMARAHSMSFNALEAPAVRLMPEIGQVMDAFRAAGSSYVRMTGSGSTVFAVFDTDTQAMNAAAAVPGAIATKTIPCI